MKNINLYKKNIESLIEKEKYYSQRSCDWSMSVVFSSYDSYIIDQVDIYWPLVGDGIRPKVISLDGSLCLLKKIIDDRRVFDAYFNTINSTSISIARTAYKIMEMSVQNQIPVDSISKRIARFKRGKKTDQTYNDLNNLIIEYRSILNKNNIYDRSMIYENFCGLLDSANYPDNLKAIGKNIVSDNSISEKFRSNKINKDDRIEGKTRNIIQNHDYSSYQDMKNGLINLIYSLKNDKGISQDDIAIVVPSLNEDIISMDIDISPTLDIRPIAVSKNFGSNLEAVVCLAALAIYKDCEYILSDEEKIELLTVVYKDKNYIDLRKNMEKYLKEVRNNIRNNMSPVLDLDSIDDGDDPSLISIDRIEESIAEAEFSYEYRMSDSEFVKNFYKKYVNQTPESISMVAKMTDLIEELGDLVDDESKYNYMRQAISYYSSSKVKLENMAMPSILLMTKEDLKSLDTKRNHLIVFDASSKRYDPVLEDSIYSQIGFFDDSILSNITKDNISLFYKDLMEYSIELEIDGVLSKYKNVYIMTSDTAINGYEQENMFYKKLMDRIF